ncbi:MAG: SDR family NAD(P)-dependent oxidoreductase [Candidatus Acidiferrales bacterium]
MKRNAENLASRTLQINVDGRWIDLTELEAAVCNNCPVEACVVLPREHNGAVELVAYVVPNSPYVPEHFGAQVKSKMPSGEVNCFCVPVAAIPLTETGEVDYEALIQLPVFEEGLLHRWSEALQTVMDIRQGSVVIDEQSPDLAPLHLSDLIPAWKPAASKASDVPSAAAQNPEKSATGFGPRTLALADGGPLVFPGDAPKTLTEAIVRTATEFPDKGIIYVKSNGEEVFQSFPALLREARCILAGLRARGLKAGARVILQVQSLSDHFSSFWACVLGGITPVTVAVAPSYADRNSVVNKLYNVWKLLEQPVILANAQLIRPLVELQRFFPGEKFKVLSVDELKRNSPAEDIFASQPEDLVFFQLTSGSTGVPKCIQESHRSIIAHIHGSGQFNGYSPNDVCLNWLPVDHVVPTLTFHLKDVYLGCQEIQAETSVLLSDPLRWLDLLEAHRVTHTWSPNFGFKLVSDRLASVDNRKWDLSSVKFFMNAGEQVTLPVVREFLDRVAPFGVSPRAMQPAFGMAEVCTCMTYQNDFAIETGVHRFLKSSLGGLLHPANAQDASVITFVDLGPPMPGVQIRITDAQNQVLPEGMIGRFQISGDVVTRGYLNNDEANREAFVGDGWFNSGDLGFILSGRLTLTGREKEMIIVRGANFYCYEIEDVVNSIPGVEPTFTGSCAVSDPATGTEGLAIFFVPQKTNTDERISLIHRIRTAVAGNLGISPSLIIPLRRSDFPKTTSGKIQRNQLKKSLAAGHYDSILKEIDIALGNSNTLPDWFYRKVWRRKEIKFHRTPELLGGSVIFLDPLGLGERLCAKLMGSEQPCVRVDRGAEFAKLNSQSYRIDPTNPEHYRLLLTSIAEDGIRVEQVLHLCNYREFSSAWGEFDHVERSLDHGLFSLLFLVQALCVQSEAARPSRLLVVSSNSQHTRAADPVDCTRSMVSGLLKTVPQETPWLTYGHVDLPGENIEQEADLVLAEMQSPQGDREAAWRDGCRWIPRLQKVDFRNGTRYPLPFEPGGFYLLTGGLGGVGFRVAKYLLQNCQARLLILGRTPLPDRKTWAEHLVKADVVAERILAYQELERCGEIAYEAVDICDFAAVRAAAEKAGTRFQSELAGVIQLAGLYHERLLSEESKESFAAVLRPKVLGSLALNSLLSNRPGALFLSFSSVNGFLGGFSVGAYSAANAFLDAFADYQREALAMRSQSLSWSLWDETGMSRNFAMKELARTRGYYSILREQGISSFLAALHQDCAQLLIGLDASKHSIRRHLENGSCGLQELSAYFVSENGAASTRKLEALSVEDRYGTPTRCKTRPLETMPLTPAGEIDRQQLSMRTHRGKTGSEPPRTAVEEALAAIWAEALRVDRVSRNDNFFDLGGHSLSAAQIAFNIRQIFKVDFPLQAFFQAPVLRAQAQQLEERVFEQANASELEELIHEIDGIPETDRNWDVDRNAGRDCPAS